MLKLQRNKLDQKGKILRLIESNLIYQNVVVRGGLRGCFFSMSLSMSIIFFDPFPNFFVSLASLILYL